MSQQSSYVDTLPDQEQKELHHVHFEENGDTFGKDNEIIVQKTSDNRIAVHLGFLQINHRYSITFPVPKSLGNFVKCSQITIVEPAVPNKNLQIVSADVNQDSIEFLLELFAYKEKLLKEEFAFCTASDSNPVFITLNARVLGKGKGTPLLKNDIHCIEHIHADEENEASDWQGFE